MDTKAGSDLEYVGSWRRLWAVSIDSLLFAMASIVVWLVVYGLIRLIAPSYSLEEDGPLWAGLPPPLVILPYWIYKQATPGKMAVGARIVDAATGGKASVGQLVIRLIGVIVSDIISPVYLWVAFDRRKQGLHDKIAGTVVVRSVGPGRGTVRFPDPGAQPGSTESAPARRT